MLFDEYPEVGDCLLLSTNNNEYRLDLKYNNFQRPYHKLNYRGYHAVFDNLIGYNKCCKIIEILAELRILNKDYSDIRRFRGDMTLRITPKVLKYSYKDYPKILFELVNENKKRKDGYILKYVRVLDSACSLGLPHFEAERIPDDSAKYSDNGTKTRPVYPLIDRI